MPRVIMLDIITNRGTFPIVSNKTTPSLMCAKREPRFRSRDTEYAFMLYFWCRTNQYHSAKTYIIVIVALQIMSLYRELPKQTAFVVNYTKMSFKSYEITESSFYYAETF